MGSMDLSEEHSDLFTSLMALIRSSSSLYSLDVDFIRSVNKVSASRSHSASKRLLKLINELIAKCNGAGGSSFEQPLEGVEDIQKRWRSIEQTFDLLADKIDYPSSSAKQRSASPMPNANTNSDNNEMSVKDYMRLSNNIAKPQAHFTTKVNNELRPFKPLLTQKPHATYSPLSQSIQIQPPDEEHKEEWYEQPYKQEIFESPYPSHPPQCVAMPDWDSTPFTFVDTPSKLFKLVAKLEKAKEIAVDVEHHDYRSYLGLVCLLQITGLGEDYVVDALALRSELQILNKVFANPSIIKVFHGAKMDIMWLQRDLGIYVVSLFDTYFAARELQFPKLSLAYLLQTYADFTAQKKYQLADWRLRPLPKELIDYARADTHFLLYIYRMLRMQLDAEGKTNIVLEESRRVASFRFENPGWNETEPAWVPFAIKFRLNGLLQRAILVKLYEWRDEMARKHDESARFIMAPQFMANLCITKPNSAKGVLSASHNVGPLVRQNAEKLAEIIQDACNNPDSVDTTMPEPKAKISVSSNLQENFQISDLKIEESDFVGKSQPTTLSQRKPLINLGVFDPEQMKLAEKYNAASAKQRGEEEALAAAARNAEEQSLIQQQDEIQKALRERQAAESLSSSSGKRLNIVGDTDEFEISTDINKLNARQPAEDQPAFDFQGAQSVFRRGNGSTPQSFSRFKHDPSLPKGVNKNTSKFKKAKSFRR